MKFLFILITLLVPLVSNSKFEITYLDEVKPVSEKIYQMPTIQNTQQAAANYLTSAAINNSIKSKPVVEEVKTYKVDRSSLFKDILKTWGGERDVLIDPKISWINNLILNEKKDYGKNLYVAVNRLIADINNNQSISSIGLILNVNITNNLIEVLFND